MRSGHDSCRSAHCCNVCHKIKHAENEAWNRLCRKCIFSRCAGSCMGTETRLLLSG